MISLKIVLSCEFLGDEDIKFQLLFNHHWLAINVQSSLQLLL